MSLPTGAAWGGLDSAVDVGGEARNQGVDIFDTPRSGVGADLYRFGVASGFDSGPPGRFAYGNDRGNRWFHGAIANDLPEPVKPGRPNFGLIKCRIAAHLVPRMP